MADWVQNPGSDESVLTENKPKLEHPKKWKVLLHNDDFTSMEFVVLILQTVFRKNPIDAVRIMMAVHQQGLGVAGVYTYEIAEAKIAKVTQMAQEREFPLLCTMEEE
jgi:ATP-dependent Clp protease adaptor protein ClpS